MSKVNIEDVCEILSGYAFDSKLFTDNHTAMPIIRIRDVVRGFTQTYTSEGYDEKYIVKNGDVLIGMDGEFNISLWNSENALLNQRVCKIKSVSDQLDEKYLLYFMPKALKDIERMTSFVTVKHLSIKTINKIEIPLPPLEVQKHIADTLDKTQEIINVHKSQLEELDNLIKATFYDMFGDPICNPQKWDNAMLGELGAMSSGGTPSRNVREYFYGEINWYTAGELNNLYLSDSIEKITEKAIKESSTKLFNKNSLLIGMYDTAAFKMGILKKDSCANQACANICLFNHSGVDIIWLYFNLLLMKEFFLTNRRGIRQKNLNLSMLKNFKIPVPNYNLQLEFSRIVSNIEEQKSLVKQSITQSQTLFNSLMSKYFD